MTNELKINNIGNVNAVNASVNASEIKEEVENTSKDTVKPTTKDTAKPTVKHVVAYLGNGEYKDSVGHRWHKNDEQTYSDDEYESRADLHFMVKYGEMKHTAVTM